MFLKVKGTRNISGCRNFRRIVPQVRIEQGKIERIEPEAVHAAIQPEPHHIDERILDIRIVQIQLRLARQEIVHVILLPTRIPCPGRSAKHSLPVIRRCSIRFWIAPNVPIRTSIGSVLSALGEPGVRVG